MKLHGVFRRKKMTPEYLGEIHDTRHVTSLVAAGAAIVMLPAAADRPVPPNSSNPIQYHFRVYGSEPAAPTEQRWRHRPAVRVTYGSSNHSIENKGCRPGRPDSITSSDNATHYVIKLKSGWKPTALVHSFVKRMELHRQQNKQASELQHNRGYDDLKKPDVDPKAHADRPDRR